MARARIAGLVPEDVLLLVEHPPVFTLGRSTKPSSLPLDAGALRSRGVEVFEIERGGDVTVTITPTYSGCPAMATMRDDLVQQLRAAGYRKVDVTVSLSPAWTTDWITPEGREKLRAYGIAPPVDGTAADGVLAGRVSRLMGSNLTIQCPRCGSTHTQKVSQFGSTPCKASWRCTDCLEPFDYFKCI